MLAGYNIAIRRLRALCSDMCIKDFIVVVEDGFAADPVEAGHNPSIFLAEYFVQMPQVIFAAFRAGYHLFQIAKRHPKLARYQS